MIGSICVFHGLKYWLNNFQTTSNHMPYPGTIECNIIKVNQRKKQ